MPADFIVGLEVQPRGSGIRDTARETRGLTEATRQNSEENRRARSTHTELEAAERRRRASLEQMVQSIRAQNLALAQAKTDHAQYQQRVEAAAEAKRRATGVVNSFRAAIVALQVAVAALGLGALVRDSVNVALAFDRANKSLVAVAGSQQAAGREMAFVSAEADRLGLVLTDTSQSYAKLSAASRGTALAGEQTREIFSAVAETGSVLALRADEMQGALNAIQQMMSKGTVQAEELRGQLGERLPGAFQIAARAMGVTTAELGKMLEGGKVMAVDLLPKLAQELRKTFGPGLVTAVNSAQANLNRLRNMVDQVKGALGEGFLSGFLAGFADLKEALSAEELKAAARDLGESIGKGLRTATDVAVFFAKNLELVKAALLVLVGIKAAAWFVSLASAIATATGATLTFKGALSSLAIAGPLAAIGAALLAVIVLMERYISTTRLAHEAEMAKVAKSQELFGYYQTLKSNKVGLTEAEAAYAAEVRKTMEAERAALVVALQRARAEATTRQFAPAPGFAPADTARQERVKELEREVKTIDNQLNILSKEWDRLGKLPVIKLPVDTAQVDGAAQKVADLLSGFQRTAEQAERIRAAQERGGASEVARVTAEIERQNAAYQALHSIEGLSSAAKQRLTGIIEGLVGRTQDATRATAEGAAEIARSLTFTASAAEAEARLADAKSQTTVASREAAIQAEAEGIARENLKEGDAEYVAGLLRVIRVRHEYLASIALEIAAVERQTAHAATLRQKHAELADAKAQDTAATRRLTVELEAEREARARGVQVGTIWYQLLLAISAARAQEIEALDHQVAAQRRLNEAESQRARARAEFTDWNRQRDAAKEYGSEIAGILRSYGLLSEATRDLAIHEQALAEFREAGNTRTLEQIEAELRGYAAVEEGLARVAAATELAAHVVEPVRQAWAQVGQMLQDAVIDQIVEGKVQVEDLAKTILRTMLSAIAEMLKRWILAHRAMQAEAARTAAVNVASAGTGTPAAGASGMGGWSAAAPGGAGWSGLFGGAGFGGGTAGGFAAVGAWGAVFAAVYFGVSQWIKTSKDHVASATLSWAREGQLAVNDIDGNSARVKGVITMLEAAGKQVTDFVESLGGVMVGIEAGVALRRRGQGKKTNWSVYVNGIAESFGNDMDAALQYAAVQAAKQGVYKGLDPITEAAIKRTVQRDWDAFQKDVQLAQQVSMMGQPEAVQAQRQIHQSVDNLITELLRILGPSEEFAQAVSNITAGMVDSLNSQRDAITGRQRTAEEERQLQLQRMRLWNLELEQRKANVAQMIVEQRIKIETYKATHRLIGGGGGGNSGGGGGNEAGGGLLGVARAFSVVAGAAAVAEAVLTSTGDATLDAMLANLVALEALQAALNAIEPIREEELQRRGGRGGGVGDRRERREDVLQEARGWKLSDLERQIVDARRWFDDFRASLRDLGLTAAQQAEVVADAQKELQRRLNEIRKAQVQQSRDFINRGTAEGGPLLASLAEVGRTSQDLIAANRDLWRQGLLSTREMRDLNRAIRESAGRQREQLVTTAANTLLLDLYSLLGEEEKAAQLRYDLTLAELQIRREELAIAFEMLGWEQARRDAILGTVDELIRRVVAAGPGGLGGAGGGVEDTGARFRGYEDAGSSSTSAAVQQAEEAARQKEAAEARLQEIERSAMPQFASEVLALNEEFANLRKVLGDTTRVQVAHAKALQDLIARYQAPLRDFLAELRGGALGGLTVSQQYAAAMANYESLRAVVAGGNWDKAQDLASAGSDLVSLMSQMFGTSTGAFQELKARIEAEILSVLGGIGGGAAGVDTGVAGAGSGSGSAPGGWTTSDVERSIGATMDVTAAIHHRGARQEDALYVIAGKLDRLSDNVIESGHAIVDRLSYGGSAA